MPHTQNIIGNTQRILITLLNQVGGTQLICVRDTRFNKLSGYHIVHRHCLMHQSVACNLILKGVWMLSGRWTNSHRCSWITVYVSCCNTQMNFIVDTMTCTCIIMLLSTCELPSCNLFTQHFSYLSWRDTTSELWTPVHSFTSEYTIYCKHCSLYFLQANIIFHTIRLILCFQQASEIDTLSVSLGQSILVLLCADSTSTSIVDTFENILNSYQFDNLGFLLRENLLLHSSYLSLGVSQRACVSRAIKLFFLAPLPGI